MSDIYGNPLNEKETVVTQNQHVYHVLPMYCKWETFYLDFVTCTSNETVSLNQIDPLPSIGTLSNLGDF